MGWVHVIGIKKTAGAILAEQSVCRFDHFDDLYQTGPCWLATCYFLVRIGAFRSFGIGKKELLWEAHQHINNKVELVYSGNLFHREITGTTFKLPELTYDPVEDAYDEIELFGYSLKSPFNLLKDSKPEGITDKDMVYYDGQWVRMVRY